MRICFISLGTFPHIDPYLEYFSSAGHDVHFISLTPGPVREVPSYNVGFGGKYSCKTGKWKYPISMVRARTLLQEIKPDIVHAHYATSGGLAALISGFHPVVVTVHGSDIITGQKSFMRRMILRQVFEYADCVNVVSAELCDTAVKLGVNADKIEVITPGIDTRKFIKFEKSSESISLPLKLICTRRLEPVFDHTTIIKALAVLRDEEIDFRMTFAGDGSLSDSLKELVQKLNLDGNIHFAGYVPNDIIPQLLSGSDIYISASLWDGASLSLFEAMAAGLFPVVSDIRANTAWLRDGIDGFLFETGNPQSLADCIKQLPAQPEIVTASRIRNGETVIQKADRKANMLLLESVYNKLTEKAILK